MNDENILSTIADTVRILSVEAIDKANSGHPGLPLGTAELGAILYGKIMKYHPKKPYWANRDRFVLSAGHGSMFLYSLLHLSGYDLSIEDIKNFRQLGSKTPGHPEYGHTPGVEVTTGPLGQGISHAVGLAAGQALVSQHVNAPEITICDNYTYVLAGDGDLMEGVSSEACSLAATWGLNKLIVFYDDNHITIDGDTALAFTEDVPARYRAYGWNVIDCEDPYDFHCLEKVITQAQNEKTRPTLVVMHTIIGYKSANQGQSKMHGNPVGPEEVLRLKKQLGFPVDKEFYVPPQVYEYFQEHEAKQTKQYNHWEEKLQTLQSHHPNNFAYWRCFFRDAYNRKAIVWPKFEVGSSIATRNSSGQVYHAIAAEMPQFIGGSADLTGNTGGALDQAFAQDDQGRRCFHFGVREFGMGCIVNGLTLYGTLHAFSATFFAFSDYMRASVRLAALMGIPSLFIFTHDSIFLGEDGPTHQPVEQLAALRAIPHLLVLRPADAQEVTQAYQMILDNQKSPTGLILSRQNVPTFEKHDPQWADHYRLGGYVAYEPASAPQAVVLATGSEVSVAIQAAQLAKAPTRVVSVSSLDLLQDHPEHQAHLLGKGTAVFALEAGISQGWEGLISHPSHWLGLKKEFGASANAKALAEHFGLTAEAIAQKMNQAMEKFSV